MISLAVVMKSQENVTYHSGFFIDISYFYQKFAVHRIANAIDYPRSFAVTSIPSREEVHPAGCLKSPISITMKKTLITLMALAGGAMAEEPAWTALTLSGGSGNQTNNVLTNAETGKNYLTGGQGSVNWTEDYEYLTTWKTSFTLNDQAVAAADIWSSSNTNNDPRGLTLGVKADGSLALGQRKNVGDYYVSTVAGVVTAGTPITITLSCVTTENRAGEIVGVQYTLSAGNSTVTYNLTQDQIKSSDYSYYKFYDNSTTRYITNGNAEQLSDIVVWRGDNLVVPEPTTATLSLLALCGLAARRRRR